MEKKISEKNKDNMGSMDKANYNLFDYSFGISTNNKPEINNEPEIRHLAKKVKKYVVATLDEDTRYLIRRSKKISIIDTLTEKTKQKDDYHFTDDIERATKTMSNATAIDLINLYRIDTGDYETELVALPMYVKYELIEPVLDDDDWVD